MRGTGFWSGCEPVNRIDAWLGLRDARTLSVRGIDRASLSVTEIRFDHPGYGLSDPVVPQDADVFGLQLRAYPFHELRDDGKAIAVRQVRAGDTLIADMRTVEAVQTDVPFYYAQFLLPRLFLRELAEDLEASEVGDLRTTAGRPARDGRARRRDRGRDPPGAMRSTSPTRRRSPRSSSGLPRRSPRSS